MGGDTVVGRRSLVAAIDQIAAETPDRAWFSIPRDDDPKNGYIDFTFGQLTNAINHAAAWLHSTLGPSNGAFECFAFECGPQDPRLIICACGAAKARRRFLPLYQFGPLSAKLHLLDATGTSTLLFTATSRASFEAVSSQRPQTRGIEVPALSTWLTNEPAEPWPFMRPWEDVQHDPWIVLSSSGTTGPPKAIEYTHMMLAATDRIMALPEDVQPKRLSSFFGLRAYTTIAVNHLTGVVNALMAPVWLGVILVLGPSLLLPSPHLIADIIRCGKVNVLMAAPSWAREICRYPETLGALKKLVMVQYTGSPMDDVTGKLLCTHVRLVPGMGSTECGPYVLDPSDDPTEWGYYGFWSGLGIHFESLNAGEGQPPERQQYELIFRKSEKAVWQQIFLIKPELDVYRTGDVFAPHPSKKGLWRYLGRTDDTIKMGNGKQLQVTEPEKTIAQNSAVQAVLLDGAARDHTFLLVELAVGAPQGEEGLDCVWPEIEKANQALPAFARVARDCVVLVDPHKPLPRSAKGTLLRKDAFRLYEEDINALYK